MLHFMMAIADCQSVGQAVDSSARVYWSNGWGSKCCYFYIWFLSFRGEMRYCSVIDIIVKNEGYWLFLNFILDEYIEGKMIMQGFLKNDHYISMDGDLVFWVA